MPIRYADEPDYNRDREPARGVRRDRDGRDTRDRERDREPAREPLREPVREPLREPPAREREREREARGPARDRMDIEAQRLPARIIDTDVIAREQRVANAGVPRQEPRTARNVAAPRDRDEDMYDIRPAAYAPMREPMRETIREQPGARRTPYEGEFDDMPAQIRPVIDPGRSRDEPRPSYNEYFLPGDGIDREVIQSEICRYLGQDATCKPGTHHDGRRGFIIRAYRALTTEMIRSLKEDSARYAREKESAARSRRAPAPYSAIRDMTRYGGDEMMIDEPEDRYQPGRYEEPRLRAPVVTSTYMTDPGYTAYHPVSQTQPPPPGIDPRHIDPRYIPGNATPPSGRTPGYTGAYPPVTTRAAVPPISAGSAFADPRSGALRDPPYGSYQAEPRRHR